MPITVAIDSTTISLGNTVEFFNGIEFQASCASAVQSRFLFAIFAVAQYIGMSDSQNTTAFNKGFFFLFFLFFLFFFFFSSTSKVSMFCRFRTFSVPGGPTIYEGRGAPNFCTVDP